MRPDTCPCNGLLLSKTGIYLVDDHEYLYLYPSSCASPETVDLIFGTMEVDKLPFGELELVEQDNELSRKVMALIEAIRGSRLSGHFPSVLLVNESRLNYFLKE